MVCDDLWGEDVGRENVGECEGGRRGELVVDGVVGNELVEGRVGRGFGRLGVGVVVL